MMGKIAEQYADNIILTDDNPRNEAGEEVRSAFSAECQSRLNA